MNKKERNRTILLSALSVLFLGFCATAPAIAQGNRLNSTPNAVVEVEKQSLGKNIEIYTNDIYTLNNEIISLREYVDNFNKIPAGTYYYVSGSEGNSSTIERYKKVNGKFYRCDENGVVANGASFVDVSSKQLVEYTVSSAGNLSAGSAGFVDKSLLLGDGSDNAAYVEQGYRDGYAKGIADGLSKVNIQYTYHIHEGSSGNTANGCYTTPNNVLIGYGQHNLYGTGNYDREHQYMQCSMCYGQWLDCNIPQYYNPTCNKNPIYNTTYVLGCGKTENTIETATIIY